MTNARRVALVTGATGLLGSFLCERLLDRGYIVYCLARSKGSASAQERVASALFAINPEFARDRLYVIRGDIDRPSCGLSSESVRELSDDIQELWHCAAVTSFDDTLRDDIWITNVDGTRHVIELSRLLGIPRINFASTAFVAGQGDSLAAEDRVSPSQNFKNAYEVSKAHAEHLLLESDANHVIMRLPVMTGRRSDGMTRQYLGFYVFARSLYYLRNKVLARLEDASLVQALNAEGICQSDDIVSHALVRVPRLSLPVQIYCEPVATVNLLPIDLVIDTMIRASAADPPSGTILHVTNGTPPTLGDLFGMALSYLGVVDYEFAANPDGPSSPETGLLGVYDRMIFSQTAAYSSYLFGEPKFSRSNLEALLGADMPDFDCTDAYIAKILEYAIVSRWRA